VTLAPGAQLGPYEILSLLCTGGMGEVYRARDPRLDRARVRSGITAYSRGGRRPFLRCSPLASAVSAIAERAGHVDVLRDRQSARHV